MDYFKLAHDRQNYGRAFKLYRKEWVEANIGWILLIVGAALTALLPVYKPLIKKINTSVEVAANEEMGAIDISSEDA